MVTAPIKGTIKRPEDEGIAQAALSALRRSVKDAAEHVMIVDLMRNDLGRVCAYGTVQAPAAPDAEPHPGVWHLVSKVRGRLRPGVGNGELLRPPARVDARAFQNGDCLWLGDAQTIRERVRERLSGAPKVRAMEIIRELEPTRRGVYGGAVLYMDYSGNLDSCIAIRTLAIRGRHAYLQAGGGIVADSDPEHEFEEALIKAAPLAAAIGSRIAPDAWGRTPISATAGHDAPQDLREGAAAVR